MTASTETATRAHLAPMTADEFIAWDPDEGGLIEWQCGKVIVHEMPTEVHQRIAGLPYSLLLTFVTSRRLGRMIIAPFKMRPTPSSPIR